MGFFCVWHNNGGRHVLTASVLELPCGTFHDITHQDTAHLHTAKGYISVSAEAKMGGEGRKAFFLNMYIAQLAKMALKENVDKFPSLWGWVREIAKIISLKVQNWNYKLNRICPGWTGHSISQWKYFPISANNIFTIAFYPGQRKEKGAKRGGEERRLHTSVWCNVVMSLLAANKSNTRSFGW